MRLLNVPWELVTDLKSLKECLSCFTPLGIGSDIVKNIFRMSPFHFVCLSIALVTDPKPFVFLFFFSFDNLELIGLNKKWFVPAATWLRQKVWKLGETWDRPVPEGLYNSPE